MNKKKNIANVFNDDYESIRSQLLSLTSSEILEIVRAYADVNGEKIVGVLMEHFISTRSENVLDAIHELCVIHVPYLAGIEDQHFHIVEKAIEYYPDNQMYKDLLADFKQSIPKPEFKTLKQNWSISHKFTDLKLADNCDLIVCNGYQLGITLFLKNSFKGLESEIGTESFIRIIEAGGFEKKKVLDFFTYRSRNDHSLYYWKDDRFIIIVSHSEVQPGRYVSNIELTCSC